jgi:hypothetical protein
MLLTSLRLRLAGGDAVTGENHQLACANCSRSEVKKQVRWAYGRATFTVSGAIGAPNRQMR